MHISANKPIATAQMIGSPEAAGLKGTVWFYQMPMGVLVEARIIGLPKNGYGVYGFHIHEGTSCKGEGFEATRNHYNPTKRNHPQHAGDLLPLISYGGRAYSAFITDRFSVSDILGKTVVIHSRPDDFHSQPGGNAGEKIACGVVQKTMRNHR